VRTPDDEAIDADGSEIHVDDGRTVKLRRVDFVSRPSFLPEPAERG
jgi:hypothetical protein